MMKNVRGPAALFLCAIFWGAAFSAQSNAMRYIGPYTFVFLRSLITCVILLLALPFLHRKVGASDKKTSLRRHVIVGGVCGTILVAATLLQQIGLVTTTPAKSGFITALYIIIVPIIGMFLGQRPQRTLWLGAALSLLGLYLLCMKGSSMRLAVGDVFTLGSAIVFAIHIIVVDRFGRSLDSVLLSAIQFAFAALWAGALAFPLEAPSLAPILACWKDVIFVAVFSGALGYTLQIIGQKDTDPTLAALIMCLESVFAAIGGWLLLGDALSGREIAGCALMLSASIIAQLPAGNKEVNP